MLKVRSVEWHDEAWEVRFEIKEGVYSLDNYPVRITHLGQLEQDGFQDDVAAVASGLLRGHMRRGAVPPNAVVINWGRVLRLSHGAPEEMRAALQRIEQNRATTLGEAVSGQF